MRSKDLNIGGSNLTRANYENYDNFKFIDTFKYFQRTLFNLSRIMPSKGEEYIKRVLGLFISNHNCFSNI